MNAPHGHGAALLKMLESMMRQLPCRRKNQGRVHVDGKGLPGASRPSRSEPAGQVPVRFRTGDHIDLHGPVHCKLYNDVSGRAEAVESDAVSVLSLAEPKCPISDDPRAEKRSCSLGVSISRDRVDETAVDDRSLEAFSGTWVIQAVRSPGDCSNMVGGR